MYRASRALLTEMERLQIATALGNRKDSGLEFGKALRLARTQVFERDVLYPKTGEQTFRGWVFRAYSPEAKTFFAVEVRLVPERTRLVRLG